MKTAQQEIRTLRKKAKAWLASLAYYSARGKISLGIFNKRLQSIFETVLKPEILQKAVSDTISETIDAEEATGIKKSLMSRLTPSKVYRRMLGYPQIPATKALEKDQPSSCTLGRLLVAWSVLTDQSPQDFITKVAPNVNRLYEEWHGSTGCQGLSDGEYQGHEEESARFLSGICRTLIQATPEEHLIHFVQDGIHALGGVIEAPGLDKTIYKLLGQACRVMTKDTAQKIDSALKANPHARESIAIPELQALVLREEAKLGWSSKNTGEEALKTLQESLAQELKEAADKKDEIIKGSLEAVGRRGLLNNLLDALNGRLRSRFTANIKRLLKAITRVESNWEFETSNFTKETTGSIRRWLFRR